MGTCDLKDNCSLRIAEPNAPPLTVCGVSERVIAGGAVVRCLLLLLWLRFEGKCSVSAGLVHAFGSWQRWV